MRKKIQTTIYLTELQVSALYEISNQTGITQAHLIRLGIDTVLADPKFRDFVDTCKTRLSNQTRAIVSEEIQRLEAMQKQLTDESKE